MLDIIFKGIEIIVGFAVLGIILQALSVLIKFIEVVCTYAWLLLKGLIKSRTFPLAISLGIWFYQQRFDFSIFNQSTIYNRAFQIAMISGVIFTIIAWILPKLLLFIPCIDRWYYIKQMNYISNMGVEIPEEWKIEDAKRGIYYN